MHQVIDVAGVLHVGGLLSVLGAVAVVAVVVRDRQRVAQHRSLRASATGDI